MLKLFFPVALIFCLNAHASSLDQILNQQKAETISPVEVQGAQLIALNSGELKASMICSMLGYTRLVSWASKRVQTKYGDRFATIEAREHSPWLVFLKPIADNSISYTQVFESITCAR